MTLMVMVCLQTERESACGQGEFGGSGVHWCLGTGEGLDRRRSEERERGRGGEREREREK